MNTVEQRVLDTIDFDGMLDYLCKLISIQSLTGSEAEAQKEITRKMMETGLEVDSWKLDLASLRKHPDFSMEIDRKEGTNVVGVFGMDQAGKSLILNGHIDVVPPKIIPPEA